MNHSSKNPVGDVGEQTERKSSNMKEDNYKVALDKMKLEVKKTLENESETIFNMGNNENSSINPVSDIEEEAEKKSEI